jgi:hypothetical protein
MKTIFKAWRSVTVKYMALDQEMVLEPFLSMDKIKELAELVHQGVRPERVLNLPSSGIMLLPGFNVSSEATVYVGDNKANSLDQDEVTLSPTTRKIRQGLYSKPSAPITELEQNVMKAIIECDEELLIEMLEKGARVDFAVGDDLRTPLHHASCYFAERYLKIVALLLHCGADVNRKDRDGLKAVDLASNPQVVMLLYEHGVRLKTNPTHREMSTCMQLMTKHWDQLGSKSLWRFTLCELARITTTKAPSKPDPKIKPTSSLPTKDPTAISYLRRRDRRLKSAIQYVEIANKSHNAPPPPPSQQSIEEQTSDDIELLRAHVPPIPAHLQRVSSLVITPIDPNMDPVLGRRRQVCLFLFLCLSMSLYL